MVVFSIKLCVLLSLSFRAWQSMAQHQPKERTHKLDDKMGWHEKAKLMFLAKDLFKDCLIKMRQIIDVRDEHDRLIAFNVGMIMGRIREKYRFMMETYRDILDSIEDRHYVKPPGYIFLRPVNVIIAMEMMHYLELEIDKLVDVLIDEGTGDLNSNRVIIGQTEPRAWWKEDDEKNATESPSKDDGPKIGKKPTVDQIVAPPRPPDAPKILLRMRDQTDIQREEKEKSLLRQKFLMKQLGMSPNMTTLKKRFLRHWPVEDSWKLDKYNFDYK